MIGMRRALGLAFGLMSVLAAGLPAAAQNETDAESPRYTHPSRMYSVAIPAGARVREPGRNVDIAIDSDAGFGVILQSAEIGPDTTPGDLAATLEAAYLGPDKAWQYKVGQRTAKVAGLDSFVGDYEGNNARYRVVIARGTRTAYTFVFRARTESFAELSDEFDWILENFRPAPDDLPPTRIATGPVTPTASTEPPPIPQQIAEGPAAGALGLHEFSDPRLGYAIAYAPSWIVERPSPESVMFSGDVGTDAFYVTVSIQNVAPPNAGSPVQAASQILDEIRKQVAAGAQDAVFERVGPYVYQRDGVMLLGRELTVSYSLDGERFKQWTLIVPRPEGQVAYLWSYRAPAASFDRFMSIAETMLRSWTIMVGGKPKGDVSG